MTAAPRSKEGFLAKVDALFHLIKELEADLPNRKTRYAETAIQEIRDKIEAIQALPWSSAEATRELEETLAFALALKDPNHPPPSLH